MSYKQTESDKADEKLLDQFVEMQHSENRDAKMVSRYIIMALMEDKEFLEIYKPIFTVHKDEEDN